VGHIHTKINHKYNLVEDQYGVSDELLNWLKDSCIKTKDGEDLICYHGSPSNEQFAVFNDNTAYKCNSFIGFFSLDREFANCYTYDTNGEDSYSRVRSFVIRSKNLFDIKNPACVRFLRTHLPDSINCQSDILDKTSFVDYLRTEQVPINNYKLDVSKFTDIKMFDKISKSILGDSGWQHSCSLPQEKQLQNKPFLGIDYKSNSIFVLAHNNCIKPTKLDYSYFNKAVEGMYLYYLKVPYNKAINIGLLTPAHLNSLSKGEPVNIKLTAEEFIDICCLDLSTGPQELTEQERQKLKSMIHDPLYNNLDLSINVVLAPQKINLDEFSQGLSSGTVLKKVDSTWELYENSYCIIDGQKVHILDWLKEEGFDAVVIKEDWAVNIICLYKNMIKDLKNKMPTDSDSVFENYHYSDALLADLF
jgi:hypothetical protein